MCNAFVQFIASHRYDCYPLNLSSDKKQIAVTNYKIVLFVSFPALLHVCYTPYVPKSIHGCGIVTINGQYVWDNKDRDIRYGRWGIVGVDLVVTCQRCSYSIVAWGRYIWRREWKLANMAEAVQEAMHLIGLTTTSKNGITMFSVLKMSWRYTVY